nr:hemicentin-2-like [Pocillopora verrucosa]
MSSCHEVINPFFVVVEYFEEFPLRFETEKNPSVGTMEIFSNSSWQKLCTSQWDDADEIQTCMAMGYYTWFAERGNASKMSTHYNCSIPTTCQSNLGKKQQICKVPVRLNGTNVEYGGRVEVFYKGKWAKICKNEWDFNDAKVICRQLGFEEALAEFFGSDVGDEGIPYAMSDVSCTGEESELASCDRIDGKLNIPSQCQSNDKGSHVLCQPKNQKVLRRDELYFDIGSREKLHCSIHNKTNHARWVINRRKLEITNSTSERIRAEDNGDLVIDDVQLSDGGVYECQRLEYVQYYIVYINARFTEKTLNQQTFIAHTSGIISCSADGTPSPQISWSKKGGKSLDPKRFTQVSNGSLRIGFVKPEDHGTFICTMKQTKGPQRVTRRDKNILVTVIIRPKVDISGASNLIIEGNSVNLTCKVVEGRPEPQITWLKNKTFHKQSLSLFFSEITKEDEGRYTCKAENAAGFDTKDIDISVKVPPRVSDEFRNLTIALNSTFTKKCYLRGDPEVSVNWTKDGVLLSKNNTLIIRQATLKDRGNYECTAKNDYGEANSSFWIDVTASPQITKPPINQSVTEGNSVNFSCRASGVPTPTLVWVFNNADLPSGINQFNHEGESFLEFLSVTKGMEGTYKCKAKNKANTTGSSATLRVYVPPRVSDEFRNLTIALNSTFTKKCYLRGDPEVSVNWTKDGVLLSKNNTLIIRQATLKDRGNYECTAKNDYGEANSSFWIDVTASPQITKPPINQSVTEGNSVNFSCRASGVPTPTLVWVFNNADLPSGINQFNHEGESFLEFLSVTKGMEGTYKCKAKNKANTTGSSATLRVYGKASAQVVPDQYPALTAGDNLTLTCIVNEETMNVTWKKDGDSPPERAKIDTRFDDKKSKFVITEVVKEHSGVYSCEARNKLGFVARSFVKINVKGKLPFNILWYYIGGTVAAAIIISLIAWYFCKRRRTVTALPDQEQAIQMEPLNAEVDEWEVAVNRVLLQDVIGRGAFGAVWRALLSSPNGQPGNRTVAAKCFTPTAGEEGRKCLMREIELGKLIGENVSPNIVKFMGCVTTEIHPILIMEYLPCGDLLGYLRKCRGVRDRFYLGEGRAQDLNNYDLVLFAKQIAAGMVFLGTRGIIHRDLAARNILLDNNYVCKVTDFGMAYQSFKYGHGNAKKGRLPIKWTAPEILLGELAGLSTLSDVWSYGIVLYEIVTLGKLSYVGVESTLVIAEVTKGYQMPKPDHVDNKL